MSKTEVQDAPLFPETGVFRGFWPYWRRVITDGNSAPARPPKEGAIETLRGLAAILIVAYHCISEEILNPPGTFGYAYLGHTFRLIRLPLFTAISGYVYAMRPLEPARTGTFLQGKARRILLPWFSTTILMVGLGLLIGGSGGRFPIQDVWKAFVFPYAHLWFLQAIFWVFLLVALLERQRVLSTPLGWGVVFLLSWIPATFFMGTNVLGLTGFMQILPFFLFGLGLRRYPALLSSPIAVGLFAVAAVVGLTIHQLMWWRGWVLPEYAHNVFVVITACAAQGVLFRLRRELPMIPRIGVFAFPIYLFHLLAISIAVRVAGLLHLQNPHLLFAGKLALGLALPVAAALLLTRIPPLRLIFLGEKSR